MRPSGYMLWSVLAVAFAGLFGAAILAVADDPGADEHSAGEATVANPGTMNAEFDSSSLLSESESIAFRLRHVADPDLPCSGPCMGQKDVDLSLRNASARCAKVPRVPTDARTEFLELESAVRSVCAQVRIALNDRTVLGSDNGVAWATPLVEALDHKLQLANSGR